jgi:hypothetical protein
MFGLKKIKRNSMNKELEEAAERHYINCIPSDRHSFIAGAKWQGERMYSDFIQFGKWLLLQDITPRGEGLYVDNKGELLTVED